MSNIPEVEIFAQIRGGVQFACPDCGNLHSQVKSALSSVIWCKRLGCEHRFRLGVGFTDLSSNPELPSKCYLAGKFNRFTANRYNFDPKDAIPVVGRVFGLMAWCCPKCHFSQKSSISFFDSLLCCLKCQNFYSVTLLIWRGVRSKMITLPIDWSIPQNYETPPL